MSGRQSIRTMALAVISVMLGFSSLAMAQGATATQKAATHSEKILIGGEPVVRLVRPKPTDKTKPQFQEAILLPGRGMALLQLKAYLPGKGEIDVLNAPALPEAAKLLNEQDDEWGNGIFKIGGAFLLPYPNRIRGKLSPDGKTITAVVAGKTLQLPANWHGNNPGAEVHSIHGLMMRSKFQNVKVSNGPQESTVSADLQAGNFGGHWLSDTDVTVEIVLKNDYFNVTITAKNVGKQPDPIGIGWHPYFVIPSGDRSQARLYLPSETRAVMNNYDDTFTTGQRVTTRGTPYNFNDKGGDPLGSQYLDDNFSALERAPDGSTVSEVIDPKSNYGIRLTTRSSDIRTIQVYAPPAKNFVAIEPQFNFPDPYSKSWGDLNTGMVLLQPGQSVPWEVRLELFTPGK